MATVELPPVPNGPSRRRKRLGRASMALLGVVGVTSCLVGSCTRNGDQTELPASPPSVTVPGESKNPFVTPSVSTAPSLSTEPGKLQIASSLCETQLGTQEGQLPLGTPTVPGTLQRPSIFVVSPDRSSQQSFTVGSEDTSGERRTVRHGPSVGIVGIATADIVFDTTQGAVWAKTCEPTSRAAVEEADSRAKDLCERPDMRITEVVVYHVGADGKPVQMSTRDC